MAIFLQAVLFLKFGADFSPNLSRVMLYHLTSSSRVAHLSFSGRENGEIHFDTSRARAKTILENWQLLCTK